MENKNQVVIFKNNESEIEVSISPSEDTVWLTRKQMADLFSVDISRVTRHINNVYKEGELDELVTCAESALVQTEGTRRVKREISYYNLDMIIAIGYRVNSKVGTEFRKWANSILKDYLIKGYSINEKKLLEYKEKYNDLISVVEMIGDLESQRELTNIENKGLLDIISSYAYALDTLDNYDHQTLSIKNTTDDTKNLVLTYDFAIEEIKNLPEYKKSTLFGREKDKGFHSAINAIYQTYDGRDVYPSIEEKAANLLYFIVKDHAFLDGNKRIAAMIFLLFMKLNNRLYNNNDSKVLGDNALVAIVLMIALSKPEEKDTIVKLLINLINKDNH